MLTALRKSQGTRTCLIALAAAALLFSNVSNANPARSAAAPCPPPDGPPLPAPTGSQCQGFIISDTASNIRKAKITVHLPPAQMLIYVNTRQDWPVIVPITPGEPWVNSVNPAYVKSPKGSSQPYGLFPPITVHALAFGSIPVTARVQLRQHQEHGVITPIVGIIRASGAAFVRPRDRLRYQYIDTPHAYGLLDVIVSNVTVDKVPLDVGSNCHTAEPATLALTAKHGYNDASKPPDTWFWQPIQSKNGGGSPYGAIDIPPFTGCHNGSDNLDRLLSAMVSGPGNPVVANQLEGAVDPASTTQPLPPLDDPVVLAARAPLLTGLKEALPAFPPASTSPSASPEFQAWAATDAGLPLNPNRPVGNDGVLWTINYLYSFFLADVELANTYRTANRPADLQDSCAPLQNDAIELYMATGGSVKAGTVTYTAAHVSPDATFNALMQKAADDVRTIGTQCSANPATGDWATVLADVHAARDRAAQLGVEPTWVDPPPSLDTPH